METKENVRKNAAVVYRLTVRTADGASFSSDYETSDEARSIGQEIYPGDLNLGLYPKYIWNVGEDSVYLVRSQIVSLSVNRIDLDFESAARPYREIIRISD